MIASSANQWMKPTVRQTGMILFMVFAPMFVPAGEDQSLIQKGAGIYESLCMRCHGANGEEQVYPEAIPLAGITLRIPDAGKISSLSAPFVGQYFEGEDAAALFTYLDRLKGKKGYSHPGHLMSPYLAYFKISNKGTYRILDVRSQEDYRQEHIPYAFHNDRLGNRSLTDKSEVAGRLAESEITPDMFVVIYDERLSGKAALAWWNLFRHGHKRVAILDGGFEAWKRNDYEISQEPVSITPKPYAWSHAEAIHEMEGEAVPLYLGENPPEPSALSIDLQPFMNRGAAPHANEIRKEFEQKGIQTPALYELHGNAEEKTFFIFLQQLLGNFDQYREETNLLQLKAISK